MLSSSLSVLVPFLCLLAFAGAPDDLLQRYCVARDSIQNQRGLAPGDRETLAGLYGELSSWSEDNDDPRVTAAELQLAIWLGNLDDAADRFDELTAMLPENSGIALARVRFLQERMEADADALFADVRHRFPHAAEISVAWAEYLDSKNRFTDAIAAIEPVADDPSTHAQLAELYWADNRFDEAIQQIAVIDPAALAADPGLSTITGRSKDKYEKAQNAWAEESALRDASSDLPQAQILTARGPITLELFEDQAPNTVANFISLAEDGYYDGTLFHRVLPKFMAQGGDPNSRPGAEGSPGSGGPGYTIADEHTREDHRKHFAGSLSMAKTPAPNSAGSQFFLNHVPTPHLDGQHTVFGRILSGLDTARSLQQDDEIVTITVLRKRDHVYEPDRLGLDGKPITPQGDIDPLDPTRRPTLKPNTQSTP
ncbi:MAG: peptidylprolyl isomerase [Phycisphaerales bacterium]|nr:peptidylprolyl isomerase [Phycisphaerales bacterium]